VRLSFRVARKSESQDIRGRVTAGVFLLPTEEPEPGFDNELVWKGGRPSAEFQMLYLDAGLMDDFPAGTQVEVIIRPILPP
jgi:hypothetical protein